MATVVLKPRKATTNKKHSDSRPNENQHAQTGFIPLVKTDNCEAQMVYFDQEEYKLPQITGNQLFFNNSQQSLPLIKNQQRPPMMKLDNYQHSS